MAVRGKLAQIWMPSFVLELPSDDVAEEVLEAHAGEPLDLSAQQNRALPEPTNWRKHLVVPEAGAPVDAYVAGVTKETVGETEIELTLLQSDSGEQRRILTALHELFDRNCLSLAYKFQPGVTPTEKPTAVSIWDGDQQVGYVAPVYL